MLEFVYKLNLPRWEEVTLPEANIETALANKYIRGMSARDWMRPEYQTINDIKLTHGVILKKPYKHKSDIHVDNNTMEDPTLIWGINWIIGYGGMEYWNSRDDIQEVKIITDTDNYTRPSLKMKCPPQKNYHTVDGGVYLVHASVPHTGYNDSSTTRIAMCMRPACEQLSYDWPTIVSMFSNFIID